MLPQVIKYLLSIFHYNTQLTLTALLLMLASSIMVGAGLLLIIPLLSLLGIHNKDPLVSPYFSFFHDFAIPLNLWTILCFYFALISLHQALQYWQTMTTTRLKQGYIKSFQTQLYRAITQAHWNLFIHTRCSDFMQVITTDINRMENGMFHILQWMITLFSLLVYAIICLYLSAELSIVALLIGGALLFLFRPLNLKAYQLGTRLGIINQTLFAKINEHLSSMKLAKSHGLQQQQFDVFEHTIIEKQKYFLEYTHQQSITNVIFKLSSVILLCALVIIAIKHLYLPATELLLLIFVFAKLLPLFSNIQRHYQGIIHALPALNTVHDMLAQCHKEFDKDSQFCGQTYLDLKQDIKIKQLTYQYKMEIPLFQSFDLLIKANQTTALVGHSGSGKSTLADLIIGLLAPQQGVILLDNQPLTGQLRQTWKHHLAYIPQTPFLFHDSIRQNLIWGNDLHLTDDNLYEALASAAAIDFVKRLPNGLDTLVGERGIKLSGGERQRIAMARALLRKPIFLLLDEATNALDRESEYYIQRSIEALHHQLTIMIIAHRLSTIKHADNIVVLEQGKIIEQGNWQTLIQQQGWINRVTELTQ